MILRDLEAYFAAHAGPFLVRLVTAVLIAAAVYIGTRIAARLSTRALHARSGRAQTIAPILRTMLILVGTLVAVIMAMAQLGVDVTTVLAGAGVVGLAVGFGAQALVKDCISGFFLILDDVIEIGDLVEVDKIFGRVEKLGLRVTQIREYSGKLWYVPNGSIATVANLSRQFSRVLVDVGIAYEAEVCKGLQVLAEIGQRWAEENPTLSLEPPEAQGVLELADSAVKLRLVAKVLPGTVAQAVTRDLRRRIKDGFDAAGLEIPYPTSVHYERSPPGDDDGESDRSGEREKA